MHKVAFVGSVIAAFVAGCSYTEPLPAPNAEPPMSVVAPAGTSRELFRAAAVAAFRRRRWTVTSASDADVTATLRHHGLQSTMTAHFDGQLVVLRASTVNGEGEPRTTPGTWFRNIRADIEAALSR